MTRTLSLTEKASEYESRVEELESELDDLEAEMRQASDPEEYEELRSDHQSVEQQRKNTAVRVQIFQEAVEEWGGDEFVIKQLSYGETMRVKDEVNALSYHIDNQGQLQGYPKEGAYNVELQRLAIVRAPPDAPEDPKDFRPWQIGEWLTEEIEEYNDFGGRDVGDREPPPAPEFGG